MTRSALKRPPFTKAQPSGVARPGPCALLPWISPPAEAAASGLVPRRRRWRSGIPAPRTSASTGVVAGKLLARGSTRSRFPRISGLCPTTSTDLLSRFAGLRADRGAWRRAPRFSENAVLAADHPRRPANERHAPPRWWRRAGPAISFGISPALLSSRDFWCGVEYEPGGSATKHQATKPRSDASMTPSTPAIRSSLEDDRRARRAGRTDPQTIAD